MSAWRIGGGSVRGPAHERTGKPNQDAILWQPSAGQGSRDRRRRRRRPWRRAPFPLRRRLEAGGRGGHRAARLGPRRWRDHRFRPQYHRRDRPGLAACGSMPHLAATPFDDPAAPASYTPYGATLLAVGANETQMLVLQIGDGDLMLGYPDGALERPLRRRSRAWSASRPIRCACPMRPSASGSPASARGEGRPLPSFVMLSTDGVSKSFRDDGAFEAAIASLARPRDRELGSHARRPARLAQRRDQPRQRRRRDSLSCGADATQSRPRPQGGNRPMADPEPTVRAPGAPGS